jgi:hypothetical protein
MNRARAIQAGMRTGLIVLGAEAIVYFAAFIYAASQLPKGAPTALLRFDVQIAGITLFSGERIGNTSSITTAAWVLPSLLLIPVLAGVLAFIYRISATRADQRPRSG